MRTVRAEPLTPDAFARFGQVLQTAMGGERNANGGTAVRVDGAAALASTRAGCAPNLAMIRALPQPLPLTLRVMERHPCSSQVFIPLRCARYLVVVAPSTPDGGCDFACLRAFVGAAGQGLNYALGTWHHPFIALDAPAELAMLAWEDGTAGDCEEVLPPEQIVVNAPTAR